MCIYVERSDFFKYIILRNAKYNKPLEALSLLLHENTAQSEYRVANIARGKTHDSALSNTYLFIMHVYIRMYAYMYT